MLFLVMGVLFVTGLWPNKSFDFSNLTAHGGFFAAGPGAVFAAILVVIFSMTGAEVATIAAAESHDPGRAIAKATNSVIGRIAVFYVGSVFLLVVILPWNSTHLAASPYVAAFEAMNIPGAADIMNAVVLTAVLSCLNSGLYTSSRMLFVLAARREARSDLDDGQREGSSRVGDRRVLGGGLHVRDRSSGLAGHGVPPPAELLGRRDLVRLSVDLHLRDRAPSSNRPGPPRGQDVAVPDAVDPGRRRHRRDPAADGVQFDSTPPVAGEPRSMGASWSSCTSSPSASSSGPPSRPRSRSSRPRPRLGCWCSRTRR